MGLFPFSLIPLVLYVLAGLFLYQEPIITPDAGEANVIPFWSNTVVDDDAGVRAAMDAELQ